MKAVFHIGHHKTGTTSLQAYLAVNWAKLLAAGILSPWVESQGAAWGQAQFLRGGASAGADLLPANVREPHNALAFRMLAKALPERNVPPQHRNTPAPPVMLRAIADQIEMLAPEAVVFCSEVMSHFGPDAPELIDEIVGPLGDAEMILHVTLRRPDDHLVAWQGQRLWFGAPVPALSQSDAGTLFSGAHFDYRSFIEPWLDAVPGIAPHIRPYAATLKAGGSVDDFFAQSNLARPTGLVEMPTMNQSLPRALFPLMLAVNAALPRPAAATLGPDLLHVVGELDLPPAGDIEFFGSATRAEMARRFAPIHDWLSEIAGAPVFEDIDEIARPRPVSEDEALDHALSRLTAKHIAGFTNPDVRRVVADLKSSR